MIERIGKYIIEKTPAGLIYIHRDGCQGHILAKTLAEARRYAKARSK